MKHEWLILADGCPEHGCYDSVDDAALSTVGWDYDRADDIKVAKARLVTMPEGVLTRINGVRVLKFRDESVGMTGKRTFLRKHYTGYTTGTLGGRDDGYPEPRFVDCNDFAELAESWKAHAGERVEAITEDVVALANETIKAVLTEGRRLLNERAKAEALEDARFEAAAAAQRLRILEGK